MKRTLTLLILLSGIIFIPLYTSPFENYLFGNQGQKFLDDTHTNDLEEIKKWEYLKTRLLPRGGYVAQKFKGPILISLENGSADQVILVREIVQEIQNILPNKEVSLYRDYTGNTSNQVIDSVTNHSVLNEIFNLYTKSISITFGKVRHPNTDYISPSSSYPKYNTTILSDSTVIKRNSVGIRPILQEISGAILTFNFSKKTTVKTEKRFIKYEILRALCYIPEGDEFRFFEDGFFNHKNFYSLFFEKSNSLFNSGKYDPENYEISEYDIFLLQKLYSDNFKGEFKSFLYKTYSKLYVFNFLYRDTVKIIVDLIIILLGAIIFLISFSLLDKRKFKFRFFNYLIPLTIINIAYLGLLNFRLYLLMDFANLSYFKITIPFYGFLAVKIILIQTLFLWLIEQYIMRKVKDFILCLTLKSLLIFVCFIMPFILYGEHFTPFSENILLFGLIVSLARGLLIYLKHYSESIIRKKDVELSQLRELQLATELNSLHAQINPHFLYNTLNSIASLAKTDGNKTEKMALTLSDLFRYSVNRKGEKMSTVEEEVEMVRNYLEIEKIRFEEKLHYNIYVDKSILQKQVPRFILQPLIENAIKHGISKIEHQGKVSLEIKQLKNRLQIIVSDNGPDFPEGLISGYGLQSVFDLLRLSYGDKASMNWENSPKKKITITINGHT